MIITVTSKHIKRGRRLHTDPGIGAIIEACTEALPSTEARLISYELPRSVTRFIKRINRDKTLAKPFRFRLS